MLSIGQSEAITEYGFKVPEGLHRCTTQTSTWSLKADIANEYHRRLAFPCDPDDAEDRNRDYHLYKMSNINGLLIVIDPIVQSCKGEPYKNGPQEGKTDWISNNIMR